MKNLRIEAAAICFGLIVLGLCVKSGLSSISQNTRVVNVKGLAEMDVKADKVTWPVQFKLTGNDLIQLYRQVNANTAAVKKFLITNGIAENEISANAPRVEDRAAESYVSNYTERYTVSSTMTVSTNKVDLVRKLLAKQGELMEQGISLTNDYNTQVVYEFTRLNDIKPKMIATATRNARIAADKFAEDSESELGKIKFANQGQINIDNRDENTPHIKRVRVVTSVEYYLKD